MSERTQLELEEHHVGERDGPLSAEEQRYLGALASERERFLEEESAEAFLSRPAFAQVHHRPRTTKSPWRWLLGTVAFALAISLLIVLSPGREPDRVRLRGTPFNVVVERSGEQFIADTELVARPGDTLRFRVTVFEPGPVEVGFLSDDRSYETIVDERVDRTGFILLQSAVALDDEPLVGSLIAGSPAEIEKAVSGDETAEVAAIRLRVEGQ